MNFYIILSAIVQPDCCRQEWSAVTLLLALRMQQSWAKGAAQAFKRVVQAWLVSFCLPLPGFQWTSHDGAGSPYKLVQLPPIPVLDSTFSTQWCSTLPRPPQSQKKGPEKGSADPEGPQSPQQVEATLGLSCRWQSYVRTSTVCCRCEHWGI